MYGFREAGKAAQNGADAVGRRVFDGEYPTGGKGERTLRESVVFGK